MKSKRRRLECSEEYARRHYLPRFCRVGFEAACNGLRKAIPDYSSKADIAIADGIKALAKRSIYLRARAVNWAESLLLNMVGDTRLEPQVRRAAEVAWRWRTAAHAVRAVAMGHGPELDKFRVSQFLRALRLSEIHHLGGKR